jgi:hypothetical protein
MCRINLIPFFSRPGAGDTEETAGLAVSGRRPNEAPATHLSAD